MRSLLRHELFTRWGPVLGWSVLLSILGVIYVILYPEMSDKVDAIADLSIYKMFGVDLLSFEGIMASSVLQNFPLILGIYVIMAGTGTLAGEEDNGTLELIVTAPLKRWQVLTVKAAALTTVTFLIVAIAAAATSLSLFTIMDQVELRVTPVKFFLSMLTAWPISMVFLTMGLFLGAWLPNRRISSMTATTIFILMYIAKLLTEAVASLHFLKPLTLFHYFDTTAALFTQGIKVRDVGLLLGLSALFFILALICFERRDITVGLWPWQRIQARRARRRAM